MRADQAGAAGDQNTLVFHASYSLFDDVAGDAFASARQRRNLAGTPATTANGSTSAIDDRAGADDGALADGDARQDGGVGADVGPGADADRLDLEIGRTIGTSTGKPVWAEPEHLRARAPADVVLDDEVARVEVGLRPDPDVVADDAGAVEAALDDRPARR